MSVPLSRPDRPTAAAVDLRPPWPTLAALVVVGLAQAAALMASALLLRAVIDRLGAGVVPSDLFPLAGAFAAVGLVLAAARAAAFVVSERVGYRMVADLRMVLHAHLLDLPARAVTRTSQGAILLRFTGDLSTYRTWISRGVGRGVVGAITLVGGLGVLTVIDPLLGLAVVSVLLFGAAASAFGGLRVRRSTRAVRWRRSLLASNVAEQIRSLAVVQTFGRRRGESDRLATQNDDLLGALDRAVSARAGLRLVSSAAGSLAVAAVLLVGLFQLERAQVTIGGVVAAMTTARFLTGPVRTIWRAYEYRQAAEISRRKLEDFLSRPTRAAPTGELRPLRCRRGRLVFEGVVVDEALDGIDLEVDPGELVAITGPNGAGKSTLLGVVARSVEPDGGRVLIDGNDLARCTIDSTIRHIGVVSPDLPLMRGTIRRNLTYRYRQADEALLRRAVLDCRVDEVLGAIDGDLSTWLVEGGMNLSIGQRQRIMLARATLGNPRLLLLDEPTANLDAATQEVFRRVIARYRGTVLLVTHDPVEASLADRVVIMEAGQITDVVSGPAYQADNQRKRRMAAGRPIW